jgi:Alpha 1,4-glycosyltransferase conserved region/Glycosyltransferase sugar-binding region containing DXD motif
VSAADHAVIQSLWIGDRLSTMEQLSIRSFLAHGHPYHLYAYEEIQGVPPEAVIKDASEILPASAIFRYYEHDSVAGFANFFRYKLLLEKGGWWSDSDLVCLKPFDFDDPYVFSSQHNQFLTAEEVCVGALKSPAGSDFASYLWDVCKSKDTATLRWGETGPQLTQAAVRKFGLDRYVRSAATFCPIPFKTWTDLLDGDRTWHFGEETYAVHLWNELWRREGRDKDSVYDANCLYERLKRHYGVAAAEY